jgi:hypothetical protein
VGQFETRVPRRLKAAIDVAQVTARAEAAPLQDKFKLTRYPKSISLDKISD